MSKELTESQLRAVAELANDMDEAFRPEQFAEFAKRLRAIFASPQVQGGEAVGEITGTYNGKGMALIDLGRCPIGTKLYATPQRAPGVTEEMVERALREGLRIGLRHRHGLMDRDDMRRLLAAALAAPVSAVGVDGALIGKLRCIGSLLQQLNAQTAAEAVSEAVAALTSGASGVDAKEVNDGCR